ncbi:MAG: hypothetical protein ACWIPI_10790, partial [Polaribacter sp.]
MGRIYKVFAAVFNWYRIKEKLKHSNDKLNTFRNKVVEDVTAYQKYQNIGLQYEKLYDYPIACILFFQLQST